MSTDLPSLPASAACPWHEFQYTADEMRAYALQAVKERDAAIDELLHVTAELASCVLEIGESMPAYARTHASELAHLRAQIQIMRGQS